MGSLKKETLLGWWKKLPLGKAAVLLGICGIALLYAGSLWDSSPAPQEEGDAPQEDGAAYREELEEDLRALVRAITGEESPQVLVTLEDQGEHVYAQDSSHSAQTGEGEEDSSSQTGHVILKDREGNQHALEITQGSPQIKGVVIVSARGGEAQFQERLTMAVRTALDLPSTRVLVTEAG